MTILTTNNVSHIERAMLRPGRIDTVIELGKLDRGSLERLIKAYCGENLAGPINLEVLVGSGRWIYPFLYL